MKNVLNIVVMIKTSMNVVCYKLMAFKTNYNEVLELIDHIDPVSYCKNRNYVNGNVTKLSPYISRGVISTKQVLKVSLEKVNSFKSIEKFIQELVWRDYWQMYWKIKGFDKFETLQDFNIPTAILNAKTGIEAIDKAIIELYETGYMHNHLRMYVASIACNVSHLNWEGPSKWMYFHLKDADWGSNALSWLWVAGMNSKKKYYANQENVNKYCFSNQTHTFLDKSYPDLISQQNPPQILNKKSTLKLKTDLPKSNCEIDSNKPVFLYNIYNLDPEWKKNENGNRILLLEPSLFEKYPISNKNLNFILDLSKNIKDIQLFVGEFSALSNLLDNNQLIYFKEHPFNKGYNGIYESREWIFEENNFYPSFFKYWNKNKSQILDYL